jgi:hypothetical protein
MSAKLLKDPDFFDAVKWNPQFKVVLDHRTGFIVVPATNDERAQRGLPVPWCNDLLTREISQPPIP